MCGGDCMAKSDLGVVCDAGPLIHLDEISCIDFFGGFAVLLIPREVWEEALRHRPNLEIEKTPNAKIVDVPANESAKLRSLSSSLGLHIGERTALRLMETSGVRCCFAMTARRGLLRNLWGMKYTEQLVWSSAPCVVAFAPVNK